MKIAAICMVSLCLFGACTNQKKEKFDVLILNATLVNVQSGELLPDQLIAISSDTIWVVDQVSNKDQYEAGQMLDAKSRFVMPGLWDMHVHFRGGDSLIDENKKLLALFLAYGITTVRDAGGDMTPSVLSWRNQIINSTLDGPTIFTSGPKLDGTKRGWAGSIKVANTNEIEAALYSLQAIGADYVKMYDGSLTKETFYGIIQAAEKRSLKTTGHIPLSADLLTAMDYGLDGTEHMDYTLKACSPLTDSLTRLGLGYEIMNQIIASYDAQLAKQVFSKMSSRKVFITPTLHVYETMTGILDTDHSGDSLLTYIGEGIQQTYLRRIEGAKKARASGASNLFEEQNKVALKTIVPMYEAGVNLIAGSDCGLYNSFTYPGKSLHGELHMLVKAGLTPQQAMTTSVINGPAFFELEKYYGSIDRGKVADLILLDKNPLEKIDHTRTIIAVIKKGKVYDRQTLDRMLLELK